MENEKDEVLEIDLKALFKYLFQKIWIIIIAGIVAAILSFSFVNVFKVQKYESTVKLYVNTGATFGSISVAGISASQSLVKTYIEILKTEDTLDDIKKKAGEKDETVKDISNEDLIKMIETGSVNGTEIMRVTVSDVDPKRAELLAETISETLLYRITAIISNASVEEVDDATEAKEVSRGIVKYTVVGCFCGMLIAVAIYAILFIKDQLIHDEAYLIETYNIPLLAVIPELGKPSGTKYGKYGYSSSNYANAVSKNLSESGKGGDK